MRIAMFSWESLHSVAVGGVAAHVSELADALAAKGHEVHVFTRRGQDQLAYERIGLVHMHRCRHDHQDDFVDNVNTMCRAMVDQFIATENYIGAFDIVHAHDWLAANAMIWIKQQRGRRSVLTIHSTEYARCGNTFPGGRSARVREQERAGLYWCDCAIAVSGITRAEIADMYHIPVWKTAVIHNGVTASRFEVTIDPGEEKQRHGIGAMDPTVLFCGRMVYQKGPDLLLEAIPAILRNYEHAKFIFAGDGDMRWSLEERARAMGVEHAVRFLGYRNGNELPRLYQCADMVYVPSRNEPFGIVVLEAWSASKPVVVTQVGGPAEYVHHERTGLLIYPNADSVAWGLGTMFLDCDRARQLGANGHREVKQHFSWTQIAEKTLAAYDPSHRPTTREWSCEPRSAGMNGDQSCTHGLSSAQNNQHVASNAAVANDASATNNADGHGCEVDADRDSPSVLKRCPTKLRNAGTCTISDRHRYESWVSQWADEPYRFAYRLSGSRDTAADLVEDTFCHAWRSRAIDPLLDETRAWLFQILRSRYAACVRMDTRRPKGVALLSKGSSVADDGAKTPRDHLSDRTWFSGHWRCSTNKTGYLCCRARETVAVLIVQLKGEGSADGGRGGVVLANPPYSKTRRTS